MTLKSCVNSSFMASIYDLNVSYNRKHSREKTFANFEILWLFAKVFFMKFGGVASIGGTSEQFTKVFSTKIVFSTNSWKFYSSKVLHYMVWLWMYCWVLSICLSWHVVCSNKIIEGSCVNLSGIMASIYVLECTRQFEFYKYTLYIGMQYATWFRSNSKNIKSSTQLTKVQYTQL